MADLYIPRQPDDDEVSLISMRELAPSPIEDDAFYTTSDDSTTRPLSKSTTLHHSPHSSLALWLARTQKYSSYAFLTFLGIHGATAAASPLLFGVDAGNASLLLARTYFYQASPYTELLLIPGSLALHITSGLALRLHRHFRQRTRYGGCSPASVSMWRWRNFSGVSRTGWLAVPFVAAHATLNRLVPLWVDGDSSQVGLEYVAFGFWHGHWGMWVGGAIYTTFVGLVSYHAVHGAASYLKVAERRRKVVGVAAAGTAVVWLAGLGRVVVDAGKVGGYLGRHYERLYSMFLRQL